MPEYAGYVLYRDLLLQEPLGQRMAQGVERLVVARGPDAGAARTPYEYVGEVGGCAERVEGRHLANEQLRARGSLRAPFPQVVDHRPADVVEQR